MENNFDQFFKKKIDQRSFEYRDVYWKEMEKMLDKADATTKRRLPLFWLVFAFFLIGGSLIGYWLISDSDDQSEQLIQMADKEQSKISDVNEKMKSIANETNNPETLENMNSSDSANEGSTNESDSPSQIPISNYKLPQLIDRSSDQQNEKHKPFVGESNRQSQKSIENIYAANSSGQDIETENISFDQAITSNSEDASVEIADVRLTREGLRSALLLSSLSRLDALVLYSRIQPNIDYLPQDPFAEFGTKIVRRNKLAIGFNAGLNTTTELYGLLAGVVLRYDIHPVWTVQAGISYNRLEGQSPITKKANVLEYGFRATANEAYLKAKSFHMIGIPLSLNYSLYAHNFGLNAQLNYLAGIRGDISSIDNENGNTRVHQNWIVTDGFNRLIPTIGFQYGYDFNKRTSVQLNFNYQIKDLSNSAYEMDNDIDLGFDSSLWAGISIQYFLRK